MSAETYLSLFDLVVISTTITITITTTTHNQYRAIRLIIHASVLSLSIHSFIHVTHSRHSFFFTISCLLFVMYTSASNEYPLLLRLNVVFVASLARRCFGGGG